MKNKRKKQVRYAIWVILLLICTTLAIAAYSKFFYPMEKLKELDKFTSIFEVALILLLCVFRLQYAMWLIASLIFASWGGYAMYWICLKLPCTCFGSMIALPSELALGLDIAFFALSCTLAFLLGASRSILYLTVLCAMQSALFAYAFAEWVFYKKILGMIWTLF